MSYLIDCLIPETLTYERFASALDLSDRRCRNLWPKAAYLVHSVIERGTYVHHTDGAVPICAHYWQRLIGNDARLIRETLCRIGVLELVSEKDQAQRKARTFRIGSAFCSDRLRWVRLARCPALVAKVARSRKRSNAKLGDAKRWVIQNLNQVSLPPSAMTAVNRAEHPSQLHQARVLLALHRLERRELWVSSDGESENRLYHPVANLPKNIRQQLHVAGEPVGEADMSAAMPYLCLALYDEADSSERAAYASAVTGSGFYELVRDHLPPESARNYADWQASRGEFKKDFNAYVLNAGLRGAPHPVFLAFRQLFPRLGQKLAQQRFTKHGALELGNRLRLLEGKLFFGRIVPRIRATLPDCVAITIHDGILCQRRFVHQVAKIIADEAAMEYGARPIVKVSVAEDASMARAA
jgi:hypothetical protein